MKNRCSMMARVSMIVLAIALSMGIAPATSMAAVTGYSGKIFDPASNKQKVLFSYKHESEQKGDVRFVTNTYTDTDGKVAAVETVEFAKIGNEEKVRLYKMSQKQLGTEGSVEIKDGEAHFSFTKDGKTKTAKEKAADDFIVGPSIVAHLRKNWEKIKSGGTVKGRFAVLDRLETVGFDYFKDKEVDINGQKATVVKMKPSSFIIAALVKPLNFYLSQDASKLLEVHGRTQVKLNEGGKWKDLDAVTVYEQ